MIRVFLGYSRAAPVASSVAAHSIVSRASAPVCVTYLALNQLHGVYNRPRDPLQSTDFSFSRFLVPYLCGYEGWALFMDDDIVVMDDIAKLWDLRDNQAAVQVVKHLHEPKGEVKFLDKVQTRYEKKNWSSVMLFNCERCQALTPAYVNAASGLDLHKFRWLTNEDLIGSLPARWNHLVGGYDDQSARYADGLGVLHYTEGGPFYHEFRDCRDSEYWHRERAAMLHCDQRI